MIVWRGIAICVGGFVMMIAEPALGATPAEKATEMFRLCHEMEQAGDATSCWKTWLSKHREHGHEAEVMLAEERVQKAGGSEVPAAEPVVTLEDSAPAEDGVVLDEQPAGVVLDEASEPEPEPEESPEVAAPVSSVAGGVLDFCQLKPDINSEKFTKKRAIFFGLAGVEVLDQSELRSVGGAGLVSGVFASRLPLERMHNVLTSVPLPGAVHEQEMLRASEVAAFLSPNGAELSEEEETERAFTLYSLGCTDYIVVPEIVEHEIKWQEKEVTQKDGSKRKLKLLDLHLTARVTLFENRDGEFVRIASLKASVPTMLTALSDASAQTAAAMEDSAKKSMPKLGVTGSAGDGLAIAQAHISAIPSGCPIPGMGSDGMALGCAPQGSVSSWLQLSEVSERFGTECKQARESGAPADSMVCETRVRAEMLVASIRTATRKVRGWKLFAPLRHGVGDRRDAPGVSLGKEEGVRVGWGFEIRKEGKRVGYLKVTKVGPGGNRGETDRSRLNLRAGKAPEGARLSEFPLLGVTVGGTLGFAALFQNQAETVFETAEGRAAYRLPALLLGGGVNAGFDLSPVVGLSETYMKTSFSILGGNGASTQVVLLPIDVIFEKGFYLGPRMVLYGGIGPTISIVSVKTFTTSIGGETQNLSATTFGMKAAGGLSFMISPHLDFQVEGLIRPSFTRAKYKATDEDGEEVPVLLGFDTRNDKFGNLGLQAGARVMF